MEMEYNQYVIRKGSSLAYESLKYSPADRSVRNCIFAFSRPGFPLSFEQMLARVSRSLLVHLFRRQISNSANTWYRTAEVFPRIRLFRLTVRKVFGRKLDE